MGGAGIGANRLIPETVLGGGKARLTAFGGPLIPTRTKTMVITGSTAPVYLGRDNVRPCNDSVRTE